MYRQKRILSIVLQLAGYLFVQFIFDRHKQTHARTHTLKQHARERTRKRKLLWEIFLKILLKICKITSSDLLCVTVFMQLSLL
jgi:hypothetical protein